MNNKEAVFRAIGYEEEYIGKKYKKLFSNNDFQYAWKIQQQKFQIIQLKKQYFLIYKDIGFAQILQQQEEEEFQNQSFTQFGLNHEEDDYTFALRLQEQYDANDTFVANSNYQGNTQLHKKQASHTQSQQQKKNGKNNDKQKTHNQSVNNQKRKTSSNQNSNNQMHQSQFAKDFYQSGNVKYDFQDVKQDDVEVQREIQRQIAKENKSKQENARSIFDDFDEPNSHVTPNKKSSSSQQQLAEQQKLSESNPFYQYEKKRQQAIQETQNVESNKAGIKQTSSQNNFERLSDDEDEEEAYYNQQQKQNNGMNIDYNEQTDHKIQWFPGKSSLKNDQQQQETPVENDDDQNYMPDANWFQQSQYAVTLSQQPSQVFKSYQQQQEEARIKKEEIEKQSNNFLRQLNESTPDPDQLNKQQKDNEIAKLDNQFDSNWFQASKFEFKDQSQNKNSGNKDLDLLGVNTTPEKEQQLRLKTQEGGPDDQEFNTQNFNQIQWGIDFSVEPGNAQKKQQEQNQNSFLLTPQNPDDIPPDSQTNNNNNKNDYNVDDLSVIDFSQNTDSNNTQKVGIQSVIDNIDIPPSVVQQPSNNIKNQQQQQNRPKTNSTFEDDLLDVFSQNQQDQEQNNQQNKEQTQSQQYKQLVNDKFNKLQAKYNNNNQQLQIIDEKKAYVGLMNQRQNQNNFNQFDNQNFQQNNQNNNNNNNNGFQNGFQQQDGNYFKRSNEEDEKMQGYHYKDMIKQTESVYVYENQQQQQQAGFLHK